MNTTLKRMAWRNLWRHKQRTILMIATVAMGSLVILVLFGLSDGLIGSMTATQVDWNQGSFQVRGDSYADDPLIENGLSAEQVAAATDRLAAMRTAGISPRMETYGMIRTSYGTGGVSRRGVASLFLVFVLIYPLGNDTDRRVMKTREVGDLL